MTQRIPILALVVITLSGANVSADWNPVPGHIMTQWADDVDPDNPLPEYPRPPLVRDNWANLNGLWDYAVTRVNDPQPTEFEGQILVPLVSSYSGMRKISMAKDAEGHLRPMLNNERIFMAGPLDQGYWPDGVYTAPTDEALKFDLQITKRFGFNSTRKHVKVEPARWYYWCDKLGLLVWQDMPNGSAGQDAKGYQDGVPRSRELADQFELEMREMIREHYNHPSIIMWVIFNESWGQYDTPRLTEMARAEDPTRLLNSGSGWFLPKDCGDVVDRHKYKGAVPVTPEEKRIGTLSGIRRTWAGHSQPHLDYEPNRILGLRHLFTTVMDLAGGSGKVPVRVEGASLTAHIKSGGQEGIELKEIRLLHLTPTMKPVGNSATK